MDVNGKVEFQTLHSSIDLGQVILEPNAKTYFVQLSRADMDEFDPAQMVDAAVKASVARCNATQLCVELNSTGEHLLINSSQSVYVQ